MDHVDVPLCHDKLLAERAQEALPPLSKSDDHRSVVLSLPGYRDTVLATTLAPCEACSDLILRTGIGSVVVGESETLPGDVDRLRAAGISVIDLESRACIELLGDFIREHPEIWVQDADD